MKDVAATIEKATMYDMTLCEHDHFLGADQPDHELDDLERDQPFLQRDSEPHQLDLELDQFDLQLD